MKKEDVSIIDPSAIAQRIFIIRGQKVMLDSHLAELYQIKTKQLNQAVERNRKRFPEDFCFKLTGEEVENLRSQTVTSSFSTVNRSHFVTGSQKHRNPLYLPYVFTEHGVAMLSSVLRSDRAVQMNIFIIRAFVKLREVLSLHKDLANKLDELERTQNEQGDQLRSVYEVIKRLIAEPIQKKGKMGFGAD